jgi:4a-hydroxytetrahydrobiopterin dehydratase
MTKLEGPALDAALAQLPAWAFDGERNAIRRVLRFADFNAAPPRNTPPGPPCFDAK